MSAVEPHAVRYECVGRVRGRCGILHDTLDAAEQHCAEDAQAVRRGYTPGHYSDRQPIEDGHQSRIDGLI